MDKRTLGRTLLHGLAHAKDAPPNASYGIKVEGGKRTYYSKDGSGNHANRIAYPDGCLTIYEHANGRIKGFHYDAKSRTWTDVRGINVSLGLPIIRTSVDHGTAFDQAGKGTASDASLIDAIEYAAKMARNR